jgi:peptide subunit release factor 1 (eRF1)
MRFQRHIDFHVTEHLKKVADELETLGEASTFELVLGGTDEIVNETLTILAEPIRRRVIGKFPVDYKHDSEQQIFERAELVWKNRQQFAERNLVDQVVEAAKSGGRGVLGVEPTLSALVEEKVRTLLIANGLAIEGPACPGCDYLSERPFKNCPLCGTNAEQRDITDRAVEKAILTGADTEVVSSSEPRDRLLAQGGLGALLRY